MQQTKQHRIADKLDGDDDLDWTDVTRNEIIEKLAENIDIDDETGCWLWTGATIKSGYGRVRVGDSVEGVHRLAFELENGGIPDGKQVNHECHVRNCFRTDHLYLGSQKENVRDSILRGTFHESHSTLNADDVREIRDRYRSESVSQTDLASEFGVSQTAIWNIVNRERWTHID